MAGFVVVGHGIWGARYARALIERGLLRAVVDPAGAPGLPVPCFPGLKDLSLPETELTHAIIAAPAPTHFGLAVRCLSLGLHTLVEKPVAATAGQCHQMYSLARSHQLTLMSGHILQHEIWLEQLWQQMGQGAFGEVRHLRSTRVGLGRVRTTEDVLWSFAPHDLTVTLLLLGCVPGSVRAVKHTIRSGTTADVVEVDLRARHLPPYGPTASIYVSWLGPGRLREILVHGTSGSARIHEPRSGQVEISQTSTWPSGGRAIGVVPSASPDAFTLQLDRFICCARTGRIPQPDEALSHAVTGILEAADRSAKTGEWVRPPFELMPAAVRPDALLPAGQWDLTSEN